MPFDPNAVFERRKKNFGQYADLTQPDPKPDQQVDQKPADQFGQYADLTTPEPDGYVETVGKGVMRGGIGLIKGVAGSGTRWLGESLGGEAQFLAPGTDTTGLTFADKIASTGKTISDVSDMSMQEEMAPDQQTFSGTFMENPSLKRAAGIIAEGVPSLFAAIATGGLTGSAWAGAGLLGFAEGAGQYEEAREAGKSVGKASLAGAASTIGNTLLEKLPIDAILKFEGGALKGALKGAVEEGAQEATQTLWQNLIAKVGYDQSRSLAEGIVESVIGGAGSGGIMGAGTAKLNQMVKAAQDAGVPDSELNAAVSSVADQLADLAAKDPQGFQQSLQPGPAPTGDPSTSDQPTGDTLSRLMAEKQTEAAQEDASLQQRVTQNVEAQLAQIRGEQRTPEAQQGGDVFAQQVGDPANAQASLNRQADAEREAELQRKVETLRQTMQVQQTPQMVQNLQRLETELAALRGQTQPQEAMPQPQGLESFVPQQAPLRNPNRLLPAPAIQVTPEGTAFTTQQYNDLVNQGMPQGDLGMWEREIPGLQKELAEVQGKMANLETTPEKSRTPRQRKNLSTFKAREATILDDLRQRNEQVRQRQVAQAEPEQNEGTAADNELKHTLINVWGGDAIRRSAPPEVLEQADKELRAAIGTAISDDEKHTLAYNWAAKAQQYQSPSGTFSQEPSDIGKKLIDLAQKRAEQNKTKGISILPSDGGFAVVLDGYIIDRADTEDAAINKADYADQEFWRDEIAGDPDSFERYQPAAPPSAETPQTGVAATLQSLKGIQQTFTVTDDAAALKGYVFARNKKGKLFVVAPDGSLKNGQGLEDRIARLEKSGKTEAYTAIAGVKPGKTRVVGENTGTAVQNFTTDEGLSVDPFAEPTAEDTRRLAAEIDAADIESNAKNSEKLVIDGFKKNAEISANSLAHSWYIEEGYPVKEVTAALRNYAQGKKLAPKQKQIVAAWQDALDRRLSEAGITGNAFEESAYEPEWNETDRLIRDAYEMAKAVDENAADAIMESSRSDAEILQALLAITEQNNGQISTEGLGADQEGQTDGLRADQKATQAAQKVGDDGKPFATPPTFGKKAQPGQNVTTLAMEDEMAVAADDAKQMEFDSPPEYGTVKEKGGKYGQAEFNFDAVPDDTGKTTGRDETGGNLYPAGRLSYYRPKGYPAIPRKIRANLAAQVDQVQTGTFKLGLSKVESAADAAHVLAALRKKAKENFVALILGKNNQPLAVLDVSTGSASASIVDPKVFAGAMMDVPGAASVWLGHNHPTGNPLPSREDIAITERLEDLLYGSGMTVSGHIVIGSSGNFMSIGQNKDAGKATPAPRTGTIPKIDSQLKRTSKDNPLTDSEAVLKYLKGRGSGVLLANTKNIPVAWIPMTADEMRELRQGDIDKGQSLILRATSQSNASVMFISFPSLADRDAAENVIRFGNAAGLRALDAVTADGESLALERSMPDDSAFFSRKDARKTALSENGQPLQFYHGTKQDVSAFNTPSWFTTKAEIASVYANNKKQEGGQRVYPVELGIQKPLDLPFDAIKDLTPGQIRAYRQAGYDGAVSRMSDEVVAVPFAPEQIRSRFNAEPFGTVASFQRNTGTGTQLADLEAGLKDSLAKLPGALGKVHLHQSENELPVDLVYILKSENMSGQFDGVYWRGNIHLVADNLDSLETAQKALIHEARHLGLEHILGGNKKPVLAQAAIVFNKEVAQYLDRYKIEKTQPNRLMAAEEILVDLVRQNKAHKFLDSVIAKVREWVRSVFPGLNLSKAELRNLIANVDTYITTGEGVDFIHRGEAMAYQRKAPFSEAFKKWFGDSKVVDENGEPLVVYHGTKADFDTFDTAKSKDFGIHFGNIGQANAAIAKTKFESAENGRVVPVYLKMENPLELDYDPLVVETEDYYVDGSYHNDLLEKILYDATGKTSAWYENATKEVETILDEVFSAADAVDSFATGLLEADDLRDLFNSSEIKSFHSALGILIERLGYDGVIYENALEGAGLSYAVFSPAQIKSATDNNGDFNPEDPRISYSRKLTTGNPETKQGIIGTLFDTPQQHSLRSAIDGAFNALKSTDIKQAADRARTQLVDRLHPIERLGEETYQQHRLLGNTHAVLATALQHGKLSWDQGALTVTEKNQGFLPWLKSLDADGRDLFYWIAAKRAEKLEGERRENWLTPPVREQLYKEIFTGLSDEQRAAKEEQFAAHNEKFQQYNQNIIDITREAGVVSQEQIDSWMRDFYLPFFRIMEDQQAEFFSGPHKSKKHISAQIKRLKGGEEKLGDPIENVLRNWSHLIQESQRNVARASAAEVATNLGLASRMPGNESLKSPGARRENNIISFQENGQPVYLKVEDIDLFEALAETNAKAFDSTLLKVLGSAKRMLTVGATIGPAFRIANLLRDTVHTAVVSKSFAPFMDTARGVVQVWLESPDYIAFMASGGGMSQGWVDSGDPKAMARSIEKIVKREAKGNMLDTPRKLWAFWEKIGHASEMAARVQLYSNLKMKKASHLNAAYEGRDLLDFFRTGASNAVRVLAMTTPFLNARIQGLDRLYRGAKSDPKAFLVKGALVSAASMLLWALFHDDERYKDMEDWEKWQYHHFWIGDQHFRIPKAFEVGAIFSTLAESAAAALTGDEEYDFFLRFLGHTLTETFSVGAPAAFAPSIEAYANKSAFTGRPLEGMALERLPAGERSQPWTPELLKDLGKGLNLSPIKMEHMIQGHFAVLGTTLLGMADTAYRWGKGTPARPAPTMDDLPGLGRFVRSDAGRSKFATRYYDFAREVNELSATVSHYKQLGDMDKARDLARAEPLRYKRFVNLTSQRLAALKKREKQVFSSSMSATAKRDRIEAINKQRKAIYQQAYERISR